MTGYMVPELWCNGCLSRMPAESETTLTGLRRNLADSGWCAHQIATVDAAAPGLLTAEDRTGLVDFCEDCCPICEVVP